MSYLWFQRTGGAEAWSLALSDQRQKIVSEVRPAFITVLDSVTSPSEDWGKDEFSKMRYSGPLYFDWDAEDVAEAIPNLHAFLKNLETQGVNLKAIRLYATGGRGFHCEIPEEMVNPKPTKTGTLLLPYVYRDMALQLATETMDLRVYTARKGRMWRTPGVERRNKAGELTGRYKVSITLDQAWEMTPESYVELTSAPRPEVLREQPALSVYLSAMFDEAREKVDKQSKLRAKSKGDSEILARFNGEFPPTVQALMRGEGLKPGEGFHKIAMQLAITANALGKSCESLVEAAQGLCQSHESDSSRYNTPRKRKEELRRMWEYTNNNDLYDYSSGGIKSLCAAGVSTADLDNPLSHVGVGVVQDETTAEMSPELQAEFDSSEGSLSAGLILLRSGIFKRKSDGVEKLSNIAFHKPRKLLDSEDGAQIGFELGIVADGVSHGRHVVTTQTFKSRTTLNDFCYGRGAVFNGDDKQASSLFLILGRKAVKDKEVTYIVRKEGLDIIQNPLSTDKANKHMIWVSPDAVMGYADGVQYRYQPKLSTGVIFNTDLLKVEPIEDTEESREWLTALLTMNSPVVVGQMLGWFVSCFHKQLYQAAYNQFPLLHPNGTAGSGKSLTTKLLAGIFYGANPVVMTGASQSSTEFSLKAAWSSSASIPVIIDEYKPSELGTKRYDFLLQHFRLLYNQGMGASGGINRGSSESSFRDITQYTFSAPTVYLGESQEMQTAIVQRTVAVGFNQIDSKAHTASFNVAASQRFANMPGRLGALLLRHSLSETVQARVEALDPVRAHLRATMDKNTHDRQVYNSAVVVCGLDFLGHALNSVFGEAFDDMVSGLRNSLLDHRDELNTLAMAESSKVLNDMSMISRTEDSESEFAMREGYEYIVGEGYVELLVKESFVKYFAWCNRKGFKPLYSTPEGFINSLGKGPATVDLRCFDSKLRQGNTMSKIFRLSLETLMTEGVEMFKSKSLD